MLRSATDPVCDGPAAAPPPLPTYGGGTWAGMRRLVAADFARLLLVYETGTPSWPKRLYWCLLPNFLGVAMYRLSHCLYAKGWRNVARLVYLVNVYVTRMELNPAMVIGPGLSVGHATGVTLDGHIGARCSLLGLCNLGGGFSQKDVGAGRGMPSIGDDVVISYGAMVLGGVRIGDGANIGPGAVVTTDVAPGAMVMWTMPRTMPFSASAVARAAGKDTNSAAPDAP